MKITSLSANLRMATADGPTFAEMSSPAVPVTTHAHLVDCAPRLIYQALIQRTITRTVQVDVTLSNGEGKLNNFVIPRVDAKVLDAGATAST